jgi:hypothetical protein
MLLLMPGASKCWEYNRFTEWLERKFLSRFEGLGLSK